MYLRGISLGGFNLFYFAVFRYYKLPIIFFACSYSEAMADLMPREIFSKSISAFLFFIKDEVVEDFAIIYSSESRGGDSARTKALRLSVGRREAAIIYSSESRSVGSVRTNIE